MKTLTSGGHFTYKSGMNRDLREGKTRYDLLIPVGSKHCLLKRWAELLTRGASIYGNRNWENACTEEELEHFRQSAFRHFIQWWEGEDSEDHCAAVIFNLQGAEHVKEKLWTNPEK